MFFMTSVFLTNTVANVEIAPELGGAILAYHVKLNSQFIPILRNASKAKSVHESCCFPLVPYSNRIRHGKFSWQNKSITLPLNHPPEKHSLHGHGWQLPWDVIEHTENSVTLQYHFNAADWPFSYTAQQVFTLEGTSLSISLSLINTSNNTMPAGLGLHPYFSLTDNTTIKCVAQQMWVTDDECMPTTLVDAPKALVSNGKLLIKGSHLDNAFTGFTGEATITWPEWQAQANISTSENCRFMVLYSPENKHSPENENFFCFEPVTHCTDAINLSQQGVKNTGIVSLEPHEKMTVSMRIDPEAIKPTDS